MTVRRDFPTAFEKRFATEADCRAYWIEARWGGKPACARCSSIYVWPIRNGTTFECRECDHQTSLTRARCWRRRASPCDRFSFRETCHAETHPIALDGATPTLTAPARCQPCELRSGWKKACGAVELKKTTQGKKVECAVN
jgi:Transposase zinc-ribbon domain